MSDVAVRRRVVQLMIWRLVITTILLGSAAVIQLNTEATAQPGPRRMSGARSDVPPL